MCHFDDGRAAPATARSIHIDKLPELRFAWAGLRFSEAVSDSGAKTSVCSLRLKPDIPFDGFTRRLGYHGAAVST